MIFLKLIPKKIIMLFLFFSFFIKTMYAFLASDLNAEMFKAQSILIKKNIQNSLRELLPKKNKKDVYDGYRIEKINAFFLDLVQEINASHALFMDSFQIEKILKYFYYDVSHLNDRENFSSQGFKNKMTAFSSFLKKEKNYFFKVLIKKIILEQLTVKSFILKKEKENHFFGQTLLESILLKIELIFYYEKERNPKQWDIPLFFFLDVTRNQSNAFALFFNINFLSLWQQPWLFEKKKVIFLI